MTTFYLILIVITLLSLTISIATSIIEKIELKNQRTESLKVIQQARNYNTFSMKRIEETLEVPIIKQTIDIVDLTSEVNVSAIQQETTKEDTPKIIEVFDEDANT